MQKLIIKRSSQWTNKFRAIEIYLDEKKIGEIGDNEITKFDVEPGRHTIKAKIDWCRSNTLELHIENNQTKYIELSGYKFEKFIMPLILSVSLFYSFFEKRFNLYPEILFLLITPPTLYMFYYLTFGRNKYLTLKEV
jgi:hypothetical protein